MIFFYMLLKKAFLKRTMTAYTKRLLTLQVCNESESKTDRA